MKALIISICWIICIDAKLLCKLSGEHYKPCECLPNTGQVYCIGSEVTDDILTEISSNLNRDTDTDKTVNKLIIRDTSITIIDDLFNEIKFGKIFIEHNNKLEKINPKAFKKGNLTSIIIQNNTLLSDISVFALARSLEPSQTIDFSYNGLKEVPENAFQSETGIAAERIYLDNNQITKIGSNAFTGLTNFKYLSLSNNLINQIEKDGLKFSPSNNTIVLLNHNKLGYEVFKNIGENVKSLEYKLSLHLEDNKIDDLPQNIFKELLETGKIELFFDGNDFKCRNCTLEWLQNLKGEPYENFHSVNCNNTDGIKVPVTQLDRDDICKKSILL